MMSEHLGSGWWALLSQIALVIFVLVFAAIVIGALVLPRREVDRRSRLPLHDDHPTHPTSDQPSPRHAVSNRSTPHAGRDGS